MAEEQKKQISLAAIIADLEAGLDRKAIRIKYELSATDATRLFQHEALKGRRTRTAPSFELLLDVELPAPKTRTKKATIPVPEEKPKTKPVAAPKAEPKVATPPPAVATPAAQEEAPESEEELQQDSPIEETASTIKEVASEEDNDLGEEAKTSTKKGLW